MRNILSLTGLLLLLLPHSVLSQEYSYTHYDISDGLAGSTVYCITQDKDGFIWVGTETGVSRFDGTHFRSFTTVDGLPDVEILEMFGDSRGRVWMAPFRKSICYYYKGKIYNQENDPRLRSLHFKGNIENFAEDADGDILIQERTALHVLAAGGGNQEIDSIHQSPITECHAISRSKDGHFVVLEKDSVFALRGGRFTPLFRIPATNQMHSSNFSHLSSQVVVWRFANDQGCMRSLITGRIRYFPFNYYHFRHVSYSIIDDSVVCSNESVGSTEYTLYSTRTRSFLPGIEVSRAFRDDDGNTWFTTIGHGLYRLNSDEFRNITLGQPLYKGCSVFAIKKFTNELVVGSNRNSIFRFHLPDMNDPGVSILSNLEKKRIVYIDTLPGGRVICGFDFSIEMYDRRMRSRSIGINTKSACLKNDSQLLIASSVGAFQIDLEKYRVVDTLWNERTTTLFYHEDTTYIGTLNGLYMLTGKHRSQWLGKDIPFLRKRIAAIVESGSGVLWIASYDDAGIIGIKDGRVIRKIDQGRGLTSDICRTLTLQNDHLWVGTDKGLNRIDLRQPDQPITQYTANDGLGSNVINTIFVDSPMVYVGTPAGLTFFDENRVDIHSACRLSWLDISSSGHSRIGDTSRLTLPYKENNIRFEYAGISYKSADKMTYQYRLLGLDTMWRKTNETFLDYPTLPSGEYDLQITAINKFGVRSRPLSLHFIVATPFWRTVWFLAGVFLSSLFLTWLAVSLRIKNIRARQQEEKQLAGKISEMEHKALQAQMNPHFIFNCLNSIQQFIFNQDIFAANKYITGFSRLIRATLHNSSRSFIPLSDEISYLSDYLILEKLRFKEKMDYTIEVDPALANTPLILPPMLIQPYVENSMRHGLRHKTGEGGYILIKFKQAGNRLTVTVEDNGIGREKAAAYKTREHIEYQSKGMSLTADRIRMMNSKYTERILIAVTDLEDDDGRPAGTRVVMEFPLFHLIAENEII